MSKNNSMKNGMGKNSYSSSTEDKYADKTTSKASDQAYEKASKNKNMREEAKMKNEY